MTVETVLAGSIIILRKKGRFLDEPLFLNLIFFYFTASELTGDSVIDLPVS